MENTLSSADIFMLSVKETIQNWSVLKTAKDHGFGGTDVSEKEVWLADSIVEIFKDNDIVHPDDLEDFISEALFNSFDTIVQDGSLGQVCSQLCTYYDMCRSNREAQVLAAVEQMRAKPPPPVTFVENEYDSDEENVPQTNGAVNSAPQEEELPMETDNEVENEESDGWQVVRRSKKR